LQRRAFTGAMTLIDNTTATLDVDCVENFKRAGRGVLTIAGLDKLRARTHAEAAMRVMPARLALAIPPRLDKLNHRSSSGLGKF
jgi:hypothetical protein